MSDYFMHYPVFAFLVCLTGLIINLMDIGFARWDSRRCGYDCNHCRSAWRCHGFTCNKVREDGGASNDHP